MEFTINIPNYLHDLNQGMYQLQQATSLCDVEVECHDGVIPVHKLVLLSCGSSYMLEQLTTDNLISPTGSMSCISLKDYPMSAVGKLIKGLYTGEIIIDEENIMPILNACKFLGLDKFETSILSLIGKEFPHIVPSSVDKELSLTEDPDISTGTIDHSYNSNPEQTVDDSLDEDMHDKKDALQDDHLNKIDVKGDNSVTLKRKREPESTKSKKRKESEAELEETQSTGDKKPEDIQQKSDTADDQTTTENNTCKTCKKMFKPETKDDTEKLDNNGICKQCKEELDEDEENAEKETKSPTKKTTRNKKYSEEDVTAAIEAINAKEMTVWAASKKFKVPDRTLRDRLKKKNRGEVITGKPAVFDATNSKKLFDCYKILLKSGYNYTVEDFCDIASHYAISLKKRSRNNPLTKHWFYSLMDTYPEIKDMRNSVERQNRTQSHEPSHDYFFSHFRSTMDKYSLNDKPGLIYSFTPVELSYKPPYVIKETVVWDDSKHQDTVNVFACGNADGDIIPPFFVFPELLKLPKDICAKYCHLSDDNLYSSEVFLHYLKNHFVKFSPADQHKILLVDAHNLFLSVDAFEWAEQNNTTLVVIPAEARRKFQPIGCECLTQFEHVFEADFKKCVTSSAEDDKVSLFSSIDLAFEVSFIKERLQSSFKSCGIYSANIITTEDETKMKE